MSEGEPRGKEPKPDKPDAVEERKVQQRRAEGEALPVEPELVQEHTDPTTGQVSGPNLAKEVDQQGKKPPDALDTERYGDPDKPKEEPKGKLPFVGRGQKDRPRRKRKKPESD